MGFARRVGSAAIRVARGWLLLGLVVPCSCATRTSQAGHEFAQSALCPPERVTVTERRDVTGTQLNPRSVAWASSSARPHFPADEERDRYAAEIYADRRRRWGKYAQEPVRGVFEATGCGLRQLYVCRLVHGRYIYPVCDPVPAQPVGG
jgi:hypothetical protein